MTIPRHCDKCNSDAFVGVIDTFDTSTGRRRRYKCDKCNERWNTYELKCDAKYEVLDKLTSLDKQLDNIVVYIQQIEEVMGEIRKGL